MNFQPNFWQFAILKYVYLAQDMKKLCDFHLWQSKPWENLGKRRNINDEENSFNPVNVCSWLRCAILHDAIWVCFFLPPSPWNSEWKQKSRLYQKWNETKIEEKKCRTLSNKLYIFLVLVLVWCCSSTFSEPIYIFLSLIHGICATWMIWRRKQQTKFYLNEWYSCFFFTVCRCMCVLFLSCFPFFC